MSPHTQATLKRLVAKGVKVILASGRPASAMRRNVELSGTPWPYIAFNGAQIVDPKTHEAIVRDEIPLELAREALRWLEEKGVYAQYYDDTDWYFEKKCDISDSYERGAGIPGVEVGEAPSRHISAPAPKLLGVDDPTRIPGLIAEGRELFGDRLMITTSKPEFLEITPLMATKGNAVRRLAEMIGLDPETTVCAGDSLNDMSMLEWSHHPLTVANGRPEVRAMAEFIAGDAHEDGVAIWLDEQTGGV